MKPRVNNEVMIAIKGRSAVCSHLPGVLLESLQYQELSYKSGGRDRGWQQSNVRAFENNNDGSVTLAAGSVPRVATELQKTGYRVTIDDQRTLPLVVKQHDADFYRGLNDEQRRRGDLVVNHRQFVLETSPQTAIQMMGLVARLYPKARIFVPLSKVTTAASNQVISEMAKFVGGNVGRALGIGCVSHARVAVGSYQQFSLSNPEEWQIILFPDADLAVTKAIADGAGPYQNHRLYGFIAPRPQLSQRDRLRLEALAGPMLIEDQNGALKLPTVTAVFCCSRTCPFRVPSEPLARKRVGIWHNDTRNRLIVDVARAFSDGDEEALCSHFLIDRDRSVFCAGRRSVVILVELPEHGRVLARLLKDWELVTAENTDRCWQYPVSFRQMIITAIAANRAQNLVADVLIRADGGVGSVRPTMPAPSFGEAGPKRLIIDFVDDFERSFLEATQSRALAYSKQGFDVRCPKWLMQTQFNNRDTKKPRRTSCPSPVWPSYKLLSHS
jgi:hypothetical protein